ncbi:linear amide C-N hydrolase [Enterobacter hormaechei]
MVKELKEIIPKPIFGHKSYYCYVTYQALSITHFMIKPVIVLLSKSLMVNYIFMIILPIAYQWPIFPWHLTNLNNYTHLSNINVSSSTLGRIKINQPDSGIALATLPSSDTSVDRFIRAVYYSTYYHKISDPDKQLIELADIMNRFDCLKMQPLIHY